MPTPYQTRLINGFEEAVREHAFKGAQMAEDHAAIEEQYLRAKTKLERAFDRAPTFTPIQLEYLKGLLYAGTQEGSSLARQIYQKL